jgi:hypothetical protein
MSRQVRRAQEREQKKTAKAGNKKIRELILAPTVPPDEPSGPITMQFADLNDRQKRGCAMYKRSLKGPGRWFFGANKESVIWLSASDAKAYEVTHVLRNHRGVMVWKYRCQCWDFKKRGEIDCKHIFAERLRREEIIVQGDPGATETTHKKAKRRPARKRYGFDGRHIKSVQRSAREKMPDRIPVLMASLKRSYDQNCSGIVIPSREQPYPGGAHGTVFSTKALALVAKVAHGKSADEMKSAYDRMIVDGTLIRRRAPSQGALTDWFNDERLTPILHELLRLTSLPFIEREVGAIIDSTKVSQLMIAHYKEVAYGTDTRDKADWMKCHAIVGVESLIVMGVEFSGSLNDDDDKSKTHDINFLRPLVAKALRSFHLEYLLGDKAYLSGPILDWLWKHGVRAAIPVKKGWFRDESVEYSQAIVNLVEWFDRNNNRDFDDVYRCRPKVETLFSILKRLARGYCWARGRKAKPNSERPCTAWINEVLCKMIYLNLRTTVTAEEETGVQIDYCVPFRRFPPPAEPLLKS